MVTSGFFNSVNGDRRYNATEMSAIFDGIINDGVFSSIGAKKNGEVIPFQMTPDKTNVIVGIGRAWFNSAWIYNNAEISLNFNTEEFRSHITLPRYDAIVIEVNRTDAVRKADIKIIKGAEANKSRTTLSKPTLTNDSQKGVYQHPLAYIYRAAGSTNITASDIERQIGKDICPFVTGILETASVEDLFTTWQKDWDKWYSKTTSDENNLITNWLIDHNESYNVWITKQRNSFDTWFNKIKETVKDNAVTEMAGRLLELENKFDTLSEEYCLYKSLDDSDGNSITDNTGSDFTGKIVYALR